MDNHRFNNNEMRGRYGTRQPRQSIPLRSFHPSIPIWEHLNISKEDYDKQYCPDCKPPDKVENMMHNEEKSSTELTQEILETVEINE